MIFDIHTVASSKISVSWNVTLHCSVARRHPPNELSDVTFQNILKSREQFLACFTPFLDILTQKPTHTSVLQILFTLAFFSHRSLLPSLPQIVPSLSYLFMTFGISLLRNSYFLY